MLLSQNLSRPSFLFFSFPIMQSNQRPAYLARGPSEAQGRAVFFLEIGPKPVKEVLSPTEST
jgi:hypothetical protein